MRSTSNFLEIKTLELWSSSIFCEITLVQQGGLEISMKFKPISTEEGIDIFMRVLWLREEDLKFS